MNSVYFKQIYYTFLPQINGKSSFIIANLPRIDCIHGELKMNSHFWVEWEGRFIVNRETTSKFIANLRNIKWINSEFIAYLWNIERVPSEFAQNIVISKYIREKST